MTHDEALAIDVTVVVDVANVMGSRPDGWWRDRAAGAERVMAGLPGLVGRVVDGPDGGGMRIERVTAVIEGAAKAAASVPGIDVVRAPEDGDRAIVDIATELRETGTDGGHRVLVVTADRGLRTRLGDDVIVAGPGWLNTLLGR
ncbi:hypothetical protein [Agromyces mariniharenae]|uniref:NTP pyrophosphohydrolase n=1 Tax=Agromyces mariniharenae TaxID=2604423 RepID=A0A5S4V1K5_9MICO|nr:hypothetical protein [Agromyces mariniharenae]TYL52842.1 hypothetical protein FYC51_03645 [Agromyces mariniharenae]